MATSLGQTGTADSVDAEYLNWESSDRRFLIHVHLDAIDGLARELIEGIPAEVGGILLGQVGRGERPVIWIERYQRVELRRRSGPNFELADEDRESFEHAARSLSENGELTVVGYYRTHLRPGFQLEEPDLDLTARYFTDAEDVVLLLRPEKNKSDIAAQFFGRDADPGRGFEALGPAFPFRGRVLGVVDSEDRTAKTFAPPPPTPEPRAAAPRRLVPDFQPAPENRKPASAFFVDPAPFAAHEELEHTGSRKGWTWWPLAAALLLVGGAAAVLTQQMSRPQTPPRPLGLDVDTAGQTWRVSWNAAAMAVPGSHVSLSVRDGDQNQLDLKPENLHSGTYDYSAKGRDVTFRLELTDPKGRLVEAESFRVLGRQPPPAPAPQAPVKPETPPTKPESVYTPPKAIHRVQAVVPASIRPRLQHPVPLDVRVTVDAHGRVASAVPVSRPHAGVESFLAGRAVYAAKQWRFDPARRDGKPVTGTEIIHFVFSR